MAKYRLLTNDEIKTLEKEFVDYLIINGITADDWEKLKVTHPDKAEDITALFSDVVFEKIMRTTQYLLKLEPHKIFAFKCDEDRIYLVYVESENVALDFKSIDDFQASLKRHQGGLKGFVTDKTYQQGREEEIFSMIRKGCMIVDEELYVSLKKWVSL